MQLTHTKPAPSSNIDHYYSRSSDLHRHKSAFPLLWSCYFLQLHRAAHRLFSSPAKKAWHGLQEEEQSLEVIKKNIGVSTDINKVLE